MVGSFCFTVLASVSLLTNWEFRRPGEEWCAVKVPHDWAISGPFDEAIDRQVVAIKENGEAKATAKTGRSGALPWIGEGEYRTTLDLPEGTKSAALVFEGAMSEPEVYLDGRKIGEWKYGYTTFKVDIPMVDAALAASPVHHELSVHLVNRPESSRWYPGAGLYRPVHLVLDEADPEAAVLARPAKRARLPKIELKPEGFFVGGQKVKFQGVCLHHDLGALGAAWNADAFRWRVRKLKDIGVNAIRTAHNPPNAELLDICDEEGLWVMAETFDTWRKVKVKNGYNRFYDDWWRRDLEQLVKVCRDHPCVVMYSIGNEIVESRGRDGVKMAKAMQDYLHQLDPGRLCTIGMNHPGASMRAGVWQLMDIPGANYHLEDYLQGHLASGAPGGLVLGTETASAVSSRGCYHLPPREISVLDEHHPDGQCSDFDLEWCPWSNLPDDDFAAQEDDPWTIGQFVWTGFDYFGEPTPYDKYWPSRSSYFGIFDLAGLPKNRARLYRSVWRKDVPTLHIAAHWSWNKPGMWIPVQVYTSYPEAELFVNGRSLGRRAKYKASRLDRYRLRWLEVPFEPGELTVVAYAKVGDKDPVARETIRTAGPFDHLEEKVEEEGSLVFITVSAVDKNGTLRPDDDREVVLADRPGLRFRGVCNGDATSLEILTAPHMHLFHGQLVAVYEKM